VGATLHEIKHLAPGEGRWSRGLLHAWKESFFREWRGGGDPGTHVSSKISLLGMAEATFHEIKACGPMRREVVPGTSPMPREQMLPSQDQREPMFLQRRLQRKWLKAHAPESYNGSLSGMLVRTVGVNLVCRYLLHIAQCFKSSSTCGLSS
jgi:hypothetical protein